MSPQQNMANGNWPIPQRPAATWDQPTVAPGQQQIPQWLQTLVTAYSQPVQQPAPIPNPQYQVQPQAQQPQQVPSAPTLIGHHINSLSEIKPIEIPMDGTATYFPTFDGSAIYLRYWDQDGQIKGTRYVPEVIPNELMAMEGNTTQPSFPTVQEIAEAVSAEIQTLLAGTQQNTPRGNSKPKKEVTADG